MKYKHLLVCLLIPALLICCQQILAQNVSVTMIIDSLPDYTPPDDIIYIAGDFNGWDPGHPEYALEKNSEDKWHLISDPVPAGTQILFKFTRGSWETVEKGPNGEEINNRVFVFGTSDTLIIIIYNWRDYGGEDTSTAAENVEVIDEAFYMPQLDRTRRIWMYFPPDYNESEKHYPVLYMHDGQNVFDFITSYAGEWEVDEILNELYDEGYEVPLVVAIDNGESFRIDEYTPWIHPDHGGGDGELYLQFIVETLKPYIDQNYRTLPDRNNTGLMGSSLGGLITHFGALTYQDVFGKAGIFSPSYWWSDTVWMFTQEQGKQHEIIFYQNMGSTEGGLHISNMQAMHDTLNLLGFNHVQSNVIEGGQHNEPTWAEDFENAYMYLFGSYANSIPESYIREQIQIVPNPASRTIFLPELEKGLWKKVEIYNLQGEVVRRIDRIPDYLIDISDLPPGIYILNWGFEGVSLRGKFVKK